MMTTMVVDDAEGTTTTTGNGGAATTMTGTGNTTMMNHGHGHSPRHSIGSTVSTATSSSTFRLGQSLVQARLSLSPRPSSSLALTPNSNIDTTIHPTNIQSQRFFGPNSTTNNISHHREHRESVDTVMTATPTFHQSSHHPQMASSTDTTTTTTLLPQDLQDGIDMNQLRQLTQNCLRSNSTMSSFYASILYSKTQQADDALLYARSLLKTGNGPSTGGGGSSGSGGSRPSQAKRVVRLLEQAGLFTHTNSPIPISVRLEAVLLATQALAELQEWMTLSGLVEDPHLYASLLTMPNTTNHHHPIRKHNATTNTMITHQQHHQQQQPIDDEDLTTWRSLADAIPLTSTEIHPLAQLLHYRAQAYAETGHPLRAATFFKLALKTDPKCFASLDGLLQDNPLLSASQVLELLQGLEPPPPAWLLDVYLARIHIAAPTIGNTHSDTRTTTKTTTIDPMDLLDTTTATAVLPQSDKVQGGDSFWKDASSLEFLTPIEKAGVIDTSIGGLAVETANGLVGGVGGCHADSSALDRLLDDYKLDQAPEILAMAAQRSFRLGKLHHALDYCQRLTLLDPLCTTAAYVHVATLVALGHKRALFRLAHEWVEASPQSAASWFAVGSYYYACARYHVAQRHFCRATRLDPQVVAAWMAFGCSFAAVEESDQALASFRAAQRLAPGDATSLLYIGMEYLRTNHTTLAQHFLTASHQIHASALVQNELGVYCLRDKLYDQAATWFVKALATEPEDWDDDHPSTTWSSSRLATLLEGVTDPYWESTVFNLAYALRKMRMFDAALVCLERSCTLCPDQASAWSARGFVCHLSGELDHAIDFYHQALACKPKDPFSSEMLQRALTDALSHTSELLENIGLEDNRHTMYNHQHHRTEFDISREEKERAILMGKTPHHHAAATTSRRPRDSMNSMAMSDDGLSISVETFGDVDME